jgi:cytidylate kinase
MENLLLKYMGKSLADEIPGSSETLPLVTISREFGCPSKLIAQMLVDALNKKGEATHARKWKFINKEVLESAAKELQLNPMDVKYLLSVGEKGLLEDVLVSFSSMYVSNIKIKRTLIKVVTTIAQSGHVVLVGRGSAAILQGRPWTLHIRLQAPVEWRIPEICKLKNVNEDEAAKMIVTIDHQRRSLYELILGRKFDPNVFDVVFNCATIPKQQIVQGILGMMEDRGMI